MADKNRGGIVLRNRKVQRALKRWDREIRDNTVSSSVKNDVTATTALRNIQFRDGRLTENENKVRR